MVRTPLLMLLIPFSMISALIVPQNRDFQTPHNNTTLNQTIRPLACPHTRYRLANLSTRDNLNYRQNCQALLYDMLVYGRQVGRVTFSKRPRRSGVTQLPFVMSHGNCEMRIEALYGHEYDEDTFTLGSLGFMFQYIISECGFTTKPTKAGSEPIPPKHYFSLSLWPKGGFGPLQGPEVFAENNGTAA